MNKAKGWNSNIFVIRYGLTCINSLRRGEI